MRIPIRSRFAGAALLAATLALPGTSALAASNAAAQGEPIVVEGAYRPMYRITPPTTDPSPPQAIVQGISAMHGSLVHGEGDLLLIDLGGLLAVVRLPQGGMNQIAGEAVLKGAEIRAIGRTDSDGVMDAVRVEIFQT